MSTFPFVAADLERAAEASGVSKTTIREALADGALVAHYVGGRASKPVIRAADLDEWIESLPTERGRR